MNCCLLSRYLLYEFFCGAFGSDSLIYKLTNVMTGVLSPRETGRYVVTQSKHVKINSSGITKCAELIAKDIDQEKYSLKTWKSHNLHPNVADENAINFIFAVDTLNFSFWPDKEGKIFSVKYKDKSYTGYWSLAAALWRAYDDGLPVFTASFMANVKLNEFEKIFKSDSETPIPLLTERLACFNTAGKVLLEHFDGSFVNCVKQCNKDAIKLVKLIVKNFESYKDEVCWNNVNLSFYKRSQIVVADIWLCFEGRGLGEFNNIKELTMFADYRVPQCLLYFKILEYSKELNDELNKRTVLPPKHEFEIEIRGCSIESVERLVEAVREKVSNEKQNIVSAITIDNFLWDYASQYRNEMKNLPIHLVRTIFY